MNDKEVVYSLNVQDLQRVAQSHLGRKLTLSEIEILEDKLGELIDWQGVIAGAIECFLDEGAIQNQSA